MCMYKIYPAKIASSSFVVQSCFQIKIIGPLRSQKSLCNGRSRRSERRQGRRPSWPSTSNAYPDRFAGGRSRPEGSEDVRDAGQVLPGTRKTSLPRQRPSGTPAKSDRVPGKLRWRPQPPRGRLGAYGFDAGEGWASISNSFQICPYIFAPDFYEQQNEESDEENDVYGVLSAFRAGSLCRR